MEIARFIFRFLFFARRPDIGTYLPIETADVNQRINISIVS